MDGEQVVTLGVGVGAWRGRGRISKDVVGSRREDRWYIVRVEGSGSVRSGGVCDVEVWLRRGEGAVRICTPYVRFTSRGSLGGMVAAEIV